MPLHESDIIHSDANGEIYMAEGKSHTTFNLVCEMDGGARIESVSIPNHVLLKVLLAMVDTQIVLKKGSTS